MERGKECLHPCSGCVGTNSLWKPYVFFLLLKKVTGIFYTIDLNHKDKEPQRICELDNAGIRYNFVLLENRPLVAYNDDDPRFGQELPFERLPSTMYRASELDGSNLQEWKTFDYSPFTADEPVSLPLVVRSRRRRGWRRCIFVFMMEMAICWWSMMHLKRFRTCTICM